MLGATDDYSATREQISRVAFTFATGTAPPMPVPMENIPAYYEQLASQYDQSRFGNSYGQFLHAQERPVLQHFLHGCPPEHTLDLACGTGRMLDLAGTGLDISPNMIAEARKKHPEKRLVHGDATSLPFPDASFDAVFSLHFIMHLNPEPTCAVLNEVHRVLRPGGRFILDFPSLKRRKLTGGHHDANWHGSNAFSLNQWRAMAGNKWEIDAVNGILFLPVHRLPAWLRPALLPLDRLFCRSFCKEWASYLLIRLKKK